MHSPHGTDAIIDQDFCRAMLPQVSRTFALTIRLLPPGLGYTVTVAYLLCRVADTIEDAATMEVASRVMLLATLRDSLSGEKFDVTALSAAFAGAQLPDQILARDSDRVLREYWKLPPEEREAIRPSVQEMCDGMATFVTLLASRSGQRQMLESVAELERYCYFVAGTVGHLLTRLFTLHMGESKLPASRVEQMWALSTRFALGLQLTNIVQDVAADAERGVVFVPRELLAHDGGTGDPHRVTHYAINALTKRALACLSDAIDYCACLPRTQYRIRLFCLLAPYLAVQTLGAVQTHLLSGNAHAKAKISRGAVYRTVTTTVLVAPSNTLLRAYFSLLSRDLRPLS